MKVQKIIDRLQKAQAADELMYEVLNDVFYEKTVSEIYAQLWDAYLTLAVGDDWDVFAKLVGNKKAESGEFITDGICRALCYDFDAKEVKSLVDEGWAFIFEKSMLEPEIDFKKYT